MKDIVSKMEIIINYSTEIIVRQKGCQIKNLDKFISYKYSSDKKFMIKAVKCSMLYST